MLVNNKILPVALGALLLGGTVGALVMHRSPSSVESNSTQAAADRSTSQVANSTAPDPALALKTQDAPVNETAALNERESAPLVRNAHSSVTQEGGSGVGTRYSRQRSGQTSSRAYYDYNNQPRSRTFWQKHRDKLTVAAGTGGGALLGGIIGGRKGAAIGALAGGGGSALYTYKLRKPRHN